MPDELPPHLQRALKYILNTGGSPRIEHFDEDHEPVGHRIRAQLKERRATIERNGRIQLAPPQVETSHNE